MKPEAVAKARARLQRAQDAYDRLIEPGSDLTFEANWTDFLLASNTVYTCLEQGAKDNATSRQWFAGRKRERRDDPLLQYVHQARNADEHGLARTYETDVFEMDATFPPGPKPKVLTMKAKGKVVFQHDIPEDSQGLIVKAWRFRLVKVKDGRYGTEFEPPTEHLGKPVDPTAFEVAKLTLAYQAALIDEAERMVSP